VPRGARSAARRVEIRQQPAQRHLGAGERDVDISRHARHAARDHRDATDHDAAPSMLVQHRREILQSAMDARREVYACLRVPCHP
jgi:hypothetical protein